MKRVTTVRRLFSSSITFLSLQHPSTMLISLPLIGLMLMSCDEPLTISAEQGPRGGTSPDQQGLASDRAQPQADMNEEVEQGIGDLGLICEPLCEVGERCLEVPTELDQAPRFECFPEDCLEISCEQGEICDEDRCVEERCAGVRCGQEGYYCVDGRCIPDPCDRDPSSPGCPESCLTAEEEPVCGAQERCFEGRCSLMRSSWSTLSAGSSVGLAGRRYWRAGFQALPILVNTRGGGVRARAVQLTE